MALTPLHVMDVCRGGGYDYQKMCKYLDSRIVGNNYVNVCTKLNAGAYAALEQQRKGGGNWLPKGDNCQGYLLLTYKKQGYDVQQNRSRFTIVIYDRGGTTSNQADNRNHQTLY